MRAQLLYCSLLLDFLNVRCLLQTCHGTTCSLQVSCKFKHLMLYLCEVRQCFMLVDPGCGSS